MAASLTVVICTKDREHTLSECATHAIASVAAATMSNAGILIIDDGALSADYLAKLHAVAQHHDVPLTYLYKKPPLQKGLYGSRKLAVSTVETSHILFIDDDCMLDKTYVATAMQLIASQPDAVAVSGVDRRNLVEPSVLQKWFWKLFLLSGGESGKLSRTGFNYGHSYWLGKVEIFESDFVHGCNMLFERTSLQGLPDCPWLEGHSMCEDLVLAHAANAHGKILIDPNLKFDHLETPGGRGNALKRLKRKIRSHYNFSKMRSQGLFRNILFAWSVSGGILHIAIKLFASKLGFSVHVKS
jgi:glycosyltransferase involved in cell wall biosynthesis